MQMNEHSRVLPLFFISKCSVRQLHLWGSTWSPDNCLILIAILQSNPSWPMDFKWPLKDFGMLWMGLETQVSAGTGWSSHGRIAPGFQPLYLVCHRRQGVKSRGWVTGIRWNLGHQILQPQVGDRECGEAPPVHPSLEQEHGEWHKRNLEGSQHLLRKQPDSQLSSYSIIFLLWILNSQMFAKILR